MRHTGSLKTVRLDIASHTDNRQPLQASSKSKLQLLSERILAWPIPSCEGLVDHRDGFCFISIGDGEISSRDQRNFHGAKIFGIHDSDVRNRVALRVSRSTLNGFHRVVSPSSLGQRSAP